MTSKIAKAAMVGAQQHTAGIFADMTVDGPEIGTLVVIVDRAKNLPNRKAMKKQDPYCAARLGKEAKKTETDKRGGQTPRWDQEMRFTVHDSPDYYQLKVSVFNDDKKTDIIGESWIPLENIIKPGGGQDDLWHSLSFKGKYAGEIRMEITYYDTRPREELIVESSSVPTVSSQQDQPREAVGGPRQPKPVKRRPLPADPTGSTDSSPIRPSLPEHAQSAPLPYTPPRGPQALSKPSSHSSHVSQQTQAIQLPPQSYVDAQPPAPAYQRPQYEDLPPPSFDNATSQYHATRDELHLTSNSQVAYDGGNDSESMTQSIPDYLHQPGSWSQPPVTNQSGQYQGLDLPELPPITPRTNRNTAHPSPKYYTPSKSSPVYTLPQYHSMPDIHQESFEQESPRYTPDPSPMRSHGYQDNSALQSQYQSFDSGYSNHTMPLHASVEDEDEGPPPPPPVHRSSVSAVRDIPEHHQTYVPQPLNVRHSRPSISASPLSQSIMQMPPAEYSASYSPAEPVPLSGYAPVDGPDQYSQPRRHSNLDEDYDKQDNYSHPQQQMVLHAQQQPRHDSISNSIRPEQRISSYVPQPYSTPPQHERPTSRDPRYEGHSASYGIEHQRPWNGHEADARSHRSSAPMIKPRAISPDPRTPMRKSVSPQPESREGVLSSVPFSPDSYDQLNPNLKTAKSINSLGPKYSTPEGAREAARERAKEDKLDEGPIISSDGRVIDPSDHLPTDTWAPEPERKVPRKTHEIKLRFRHSPQGAQPMPASAPRAPRESPVRPHSISTTSSQPYVSEEISPTGRNRLQKKPRGGPTHYNSSPAGVSSATNTPPSNYPLRDNPNYGYGNSPSYRHSSSGPPPIPAKVPLADQQEWGPQSLSHGYGSNQSEMSLSDQMRSIDIGIGPGIRTRRGRYGQ